MVKSTAKFAVLLCYQAVEQTGTGTSTPTITDNDCRVVRCTTRTEGLLCLPSANVHVNVNVNVNVNVRSIRSIRYFDYSGQVSFPRGKGSEQVLLSPFFVMTTVAVLLPL